MIDYKTTAGFSLTLEEREFLKDSAEGSGSIVSIESGPCAALWCFRAGAPESSIYSVKEQGSIIDGDPGVTILSGFSDFPGNSVDLLFIDGSHAFKDVLLDLVTWQDSIPLKGLVVLHDYEHNNMPEVKLATEFWLKNVTRKTWQPIEAPGSLFALRRIARGRKPAVVPVEALKEQHAEQESVSEKATGQVDPRQD